MCFLCVREREHTKLPKGCHRPSNMHIFRYDMLNLQSERSIITDETDSGCKTVRLCHTGPSLSFRCICTHLQAADCQPGYPLIQRPSTHIQDFPTPGILLILLMSTLGQGRRAHTSPTSHYRRTPSHSHHWASSTKTLGYVPTPWPRPLTAPSPSYQASRQTLAA